MFATFDEAARLRARGILAALSLLLLFGAPQASAQNPQNTFNSHSTGENGAYAPTSSETKTVPDSGVFNFTTVNIPSGVTVTFVRNAANTPVTILASVNVTIAGTIILDGKPGNTNGTGGAGGPGGFDGGSGGYPFDTSYTGVTGDGPGGGGGGYGNSTLWTPGGGAGGGYSGVGLNGGAAAGQPLAAGGPRYGSPSLIPLVGGSGGGAGGAATNPNRIGGSGGGGGGAILIASSGNITFTGIIYARGGAGGAANGGANGAGAAGGGGGSGGAIRLVTNTITGSGGSLQVSAGAGGVGGGSGYGGAGGSVGYIRIESYDHTAFTVGTSNTISYVLPRPAVPQNLPALRIASVAGLPSPTSPLGSQYRVPDIIVPPAQSNPVEVVVEAINIPDGTPVTVTVTPAQGARTSVQSEPLFTTNPPVSEATASVNLPAGRSVITATVVIDLTLTAAARTPLWIDGERVARIEVEADFGGGSELTYVTHSGRRVRRTYE